jgi:hypothetical protein
MSSIKHTLAHVNQHNNDKEFKLPTIIFATQKKVGENSKNSSLT